MEAFTGSLRSTKNLSVSSRTFSPLIGMTIDLLVSPDRNVFEPLFAL